jgi:hypothetical protein
MGFGVTGNTRERCEALLQRELNREGWKHIYLDKVLGSNSTKQLDGWTRAELLDGQEPDPEQIMDLICGGLDLNRKGRYQIRIFFTPADSPRAVLRVDRIQEDTGSVGRDLATEQLSKTIGRVFGDMGSQAHAAVEQSVAVVSTAMDRMEEIRDKADDDQWELRKELLELTHTISGLRMELAVERLRNELEAGWKPEDVIALVSGAAPAIFQALHAIWPEIPTLPKPPPTNGVTPPPAKPPPRPQKKKKPPAG